MLTRPPALLSPLSLDVGNAIRGCTEAVVQPPLSLLGSDSTRTVSNHGGKGVPRSVQTDSASLELRRTRRFSPSSAFWFWPRCTMHVGSEGLLSVSPITSTKYPLVRAAWPGRQRMSPSQTYRTCQSGPHCAQPPRVQRLWAELGAPCAQTPPRAPGPHLPPRVRRLCLLGARPWPWEGAPGRPGVNVGTAVGSLSRGSQAVLTCWLLHCARQGAVPRGGGFSPVTFRRGRAVDTAHRSVVSGLGVRKV